MLTLDVEHFHIKLCMILAISWLVCSGVSTNGGEESLSGLSQHVIGMV